MARRRWLETGEEGSGQEPCIDQYLWRTQSDQLGEVQRQVRNQSSQDSSIPAIEEEAKHSTEQQGQGEWRESAAKEREEWWTETASKLALC